MDRAKVWMLAGAAALAGCEAARPARIDAAAIAPVARFSPSVVPPDGSTAIVEGAGLLRVDTPSEDSWPGYAGGSGTGLSYALPMNYDVYDAEGAFVRHVVNHREMVMHADPVTINIAPGRYLVAIPDSRWPAAWIEVTIEAARITKADAKSVRPG